MSPGSEPAWAVGSVWNGVSNVPLPPAATLLSTCTTRIACPVVGSVATSGSLAVAPPNTIVRLRCGGSIRR